MGRTLHYGISGKVMLTEDQKDKLISLSVKYKQKYNWQYENVWFPSLYSITIQEPRVSEEEDDGEDDDGVCENLEELIKKQFEDSEIFEAETIKIVNKRELNADEADELYGFTKVYGNEINAHNVINFVIDASKILPDYQFYLIDDGEAIYCPLIIKNGLAKPDMEKIKRNLENPKRKSGFYKDGLWDYKSKDKFYERLVKTNPNWSAIDKYIRPLKTTNPKKRKQGRAFGNSKIDIENLPSAALDLLLDERLEQMSYYDDINNFPEEF